VTVSGVFHAGVVQQKHYLFFDLLAVGVGHIFILPVVFVYAATSSGSG
jgi:hypothetical protein